MKKKLRIIPLIVLIAFLLSGCIVFLNIPIFFYRHAFLDFIDKICPVDDVVFGILSYTLCIKIVHSSDIPYSF